MTSDVERSFPMIMVYPTQSQYKALIVDDETDICYLLGNILKQRNIHTVFAQSLAEAEKFIKSQNDFSIIFLDNHLPDGFGISLIKELKQKNPNVQLVMISAHDTSSDREKAVDNGVDLFIGKPFSQATILKTLEKLQSQKD